MEQGRVVKPHNEIWKFKYCLMEIKLPLVGKIWVLDCLQHCIYKRKAKNCILFFYKYMHTLHHQKNKNKKLDACQAPRYLKGVWD